MKQTSDERTMGPDNSSGWAMVTHVVVDANEVQSAGKPVVARAAQRKAQ